MECFPRSCRSTPNIFSSLSCINSIMALSWAFRHERSLVFPLLNVCLSSTKLSSIPLIASMEIIHPSLHYYSATVMHWVKERRRLMLTRTGISSVEWQETNRSVLGFWPCAKMNAHWKLSNQFSHSSLSLSNA